jgi:hypothetical protein
VILRRYWFEFDFPSSARRPIGLQHGCGVTALDLEDAMDLVKGKIFKSADIPRPNRTIEDVDISSLDLKHVRPNMGNPLLRGVWFPLGY